MEFKIAGPALFVFSLRNLRRSDTRLLDLRITAVNTLAHEAICMLLAYVTHP